MCCGEKMKRIATGLAYLSVLLFFWNCPQRSEKENTADAAVKAELQRNETTSSEQEVKEPPEKPNSQELLLEKDASVHETSFPETAEPWQTIGNLECQSDFPEKFQWCGIEKYRILFKLPVNKMGTPPIYDRTFSDLILTSNGILFGTFYKNSQDGRYVNTTTYHIDFSGRILFEQTKQLPQTMSVYFLLPATPSQYMQVLQHAFHGGESWDQATLHDQQTGAKQRESPIIRYSEIRGAWLESEQLLFLPEGTNVISAIDMRTGKIRWRQEFNEPLSCSPVVDRLGSVYLCAQQDLVSLKGTDGTQNWRKTIENVSYPQASMINTDGDIVISTDQEIVWFSPSGQLKGAIRSGAGTLPPVITPSGLFVWYARNERKLVSYDPKAKKIIRELQVRFGSRAPIALEDESFVFEAQGVGVVRYTKEFKLLNYVNLSLTDSERSFKRPEVTLIGVRQGFWYLHARKFDEIVIYEIKLDTPGLARVGWPTVHGLGNHARQAP